MPEDKENPQNEGQGSRTAARACNEKTKQSVENADAEAKAEEAARALDGQATSCASRRSKVAPTSARKTHRFIATSSWFSNS